jgi:hypothetical protein
MKTKHMLIILCLLCANVGFAQNKLFNKYADMDDVTSIYISKAMFQMMPNIEKAGVNFTNIKGKIESLQLVTTDKPERIVQMKKDFSQLITAQHQELIRIKEGQNRINFYSNMQGDKIKELLMIVNTDDNFTAILLVGNFTLKDIKEFTDQE